MFEWKTLSYIGCLLILPACCSQFMPTDDTVILEAMFFLARCWM